MSARYPTGRSGRLRLRQRLATATKAVDLLDRKARILLTELGRLELLESRTREEWEAAAKEADRWLGRALALDGQRGMRTASPAPAAATVIVDLGGAMGVRYPIGVTVRPPTTPVPAGGSALIAALRAHHDALARAADHAAAAQAARRVAEALEETRARQRAIENRLIPSMTQALRLIEAQLEEREREERVRLQRSGVLRTAFAVGSSSAGGEPR